MALPNTYQPLEYIQSSGTQYIDTGIAPSDYLVSLKIEADMSFVTKPTGSSTQSYLFGTGHYSSTAGNRRNVLVGYRGGTSTTLFSYLNDGQLSNAVAFTGATLDTNRHTFVIDQPNSRYQFDGTSLSFGSTDQSTDTKPVLIFCARQSGSSGEPIGYYSSAKLYLFKIYNNGTLIRDFVPVRRISDSVLGLYDLVNDVFYTNSGTGDFTAGPDLFTVTVNANPATAGSVSGGGAYALNTTATLTAIPNSGYKFIEWSDGDLNNPRTITVTGNITLTAVFNELNISTVPEYRLWGKKITQLRQVPSFFTNVLSADINEDLLQKAASTIICEDDASYLEEGDIIAIRDERNNRVYDGVVSSVDGNRLTCNQMQAIYSYQYYVMPDTSTTKGYFSTYKAAEKMRRFISDLAGGYLASGFTLSGGSQVHSVSLNFPLYYIFNGNIVTTVSVIADTDVNPVVPYQEKSQTINLENMIYDMYSQFGLLTKTDLLFTTMPSLNVYIFNPAEGAYSAGGTVYINPYQTINFGDNAEFISDINVTTETEDNNCLYIFDAAGTTFRSAYAVLNDGTYISLPDSLAALPKRYLPVKAKIVNSDEDLTAIRNAELKRLQFNHKVSFTVDLKNNFYMFEDFDLGQNINFYVGDRLYNSVLTGWSFHIENGRMLDSVRMTCGKVRNNLTSKLNLGKVK